MLIRVDAGASVPLATQIAAAVRGAIARGEVLDGERLPSARTLAQSLDVNLHTVLRAYAELRDEDLLELRRGRGAVVRSGSSSEPAELARLTQLVHEVVAQAQRLGVGRDELKTMIEEHA
jgi:GntR family transcriptional regulator